MLTLKSILRTVRSGAGPHRFGQEGTSTSLSVPRDAHSNPRPTQATENHTKEEAP